jgi:hypothetical protein
MSSQKTSKASPNAISLQASVDGPSLLDWLDGQTTRSCGPEAVPASHSQSQACAKASETSATSGQSTGGLSRPESLQSLLGSKLRQHLNGSALYDVIWKRSNTMSGLTTYRPRVRALGTKGIEHGFLPTPSGTSNHGKNHVAGRLDEWGGSSNPFRGTSLGKVHCPAFELWVMGYPDQWAQLMQRVTQSSRK